MRIWPFGIAAVVGALLAGPSAAQDQPTEAEMMAAWAEAMQIGPEHMALSARAGTWSTTTTYPAHPGSDEIVTEHGTAERVATLDGRVLEERLQGTIMGQPYAGIGRAGFDNVTGRYWSTWTDTMTTGLLVMYGDYDELTSTYTYEGVSIDPLMGEVPMRVEQVVESPDREIMRLSMQFPGQDMAEMMQVVYERQP